MARYTGPVCKLCRREGTKLFLKGEKCHTKCTLDQRPTIPGMAKPQRGKPSEFAIRLREKQKLRRMVQLTERPLSALMSKASKTPGKTGEVLLRFLELRLDNVVRRSGFTSSPKTARQLVFHGHVKVNGKRVDIPSFMVKPGDEVVLDKAVHETVAVKVGMEAAVRRNTRPAFLEVKPDTFTTKVLRNPAREEMSYPVSERLIVEYYSKE
jgi:small subunit ribosomal protein S4